MTHLMSIPITDAKGRQERVSLFFDDSEELADMQGYYASFAAALDAVTEGVVGNASITFTVAAPGGLKSSAVANSDVNEGGNLAFNTTGRYKFSFRVPAMLQSKFSGDSVQISDSGSVEALIAALVTGYSGVAPTDPQGVDITGISTGKKTFRR